MSNTASSQSGSVSTLPAPSSSSTPDPAITQPLQMETTLSLPCNTELYNPSISTAISASGISSSYPVFTSTSISDSMPMSMPMSMSIPPLFMEMGTHFFDANADAHATDETERMYADFESAFAESSAMYSFSAEEMLFQDTVGEGEGESETGAGAGAGWGWLDPDDETMLAHPAGL
ncbi:hypothetical protein BO70DRAFT_364165 [Aspergillus heteromorphus CBS 117.55]|uniref:Uncharacterized protein n=1 Tax=Aspergillus heteromorphus CBS 117.55 TaxID=1448321 RepID=A0A317VMH0_9EURO|nr:uncharacterized protein BO70DRAFT_364165 [Aspergillus heteromorphus CBS 117.55]PWY75095.1 hypothetical protein BO70DRAFT_364165 [Aspergillus heteromorphus CBS 117.55]